jgi:hypothetical protein
MAVANTLAYYVTAIFMAVKNFIVQALGVNLFPLFCKLDRFREINKMLTI